MNTIHDDMPAVWRALSALLEQAVPQSTRCVLTIDVDEGDGVLLTLHVDSAAAAGALTTRLTCLGRSLSQSFARPIRVAIQPTTPEVSHV